MRLRRAKRGQAPDCSRLIQQTSSTEGHVICPFWASSSMDGNRRPPRIVSKPLPRARPITLYLRNNRSLLQAILERLRAYWRHIILPITRERSRKGRIVLSQCTFSQNVHGQDVAADIIHFLLLITYTISSIRLSVLKQSLACSGDPAYKTGCCRMLGTPHSASWRV